MLRFAGQAPFRLRPLSSNVRPHPAHRGHVYEIGRAAELDLQLIHRVGGLGLLILIPLNLYAIAAVWRFAGRLEREETELWKGILKQHSGHSGSKMMAVSKYLSIGAFAEISSPDLRSEAERARYIYTAGSMFAAGWVGLFVLLVFGGTFL
jgi:hypothetical protein